MSVDAAQRKDQPVVLDVLADLEHAGVLQQRLDRGECGFFGNLVRAELRIGREQVAAALGAAVAVADRHVAGFVVADRQREAAEVRLHRIETGGLGVDRHQADVFRAGDPGLEPVERAHGFIFGTVDRRRTHFAARAAARQMGVKGRGLSSLSPPRLRGRVGVGANRSPPPAAPSPFGPPRATSPASGGGEDEEGGGGGE